MEHGNYRLKSYLPLSLDEQFRDASKLIAAKSAICLNTALSYYVLSDEIVTVPWFLVSNETTSRLKSIHLFRKRNPMWEVGIVRKKGFYITSIERTLVECLVYKKRITSYEGVFALRRAVTENKVNIYKVYDVAQQMGYLKRIKDVLEVFFDES